ncbi:MAG: hypothetical protein GF364_15900 [Candidatus Lokiarchaeota archaeon]|nr:hypothetical protein [Candidatus Lokiarchaeota archaeon]
MTENKVKHAFPKSNIAHISNLYSITILILILFEKVLFDEYFEQFTDYVPALIAWIVSFFSISLFIHRIPLRIISIALFLTNMVTAVVWFFIAYNLPLEMIDIGCESWLCGLPGQILLLSITLGVIPPLFNGWQTLICKNSDHTFRNYFNGLVIGCTCILIGLISYLGYFWVPFTACIVNMVSACLVLYYSMNILRKNIITDNEKNDDDTIDNNNAQPKNKIEERNTLKTEKKNIVQLDFGRIFLDLVFIVLLSILGFSMLDDDVFYFNLLCYFGIGFILFNLIQLSVESLWSINHIDTHIKYEIIEFIIYLMVLVALIVRIEILLIDNSFETSNALGSVIIGILLAYFFYRLTLIQEKEYRARRDAKIKLRFIKTIFKDCVSIEMYFVFLFITSFFSIRPDPNDIIWIYLGGIILALILTLNSFRVLFMKIKREREKL